MKEGFCIAMDQDSIKVCSLMVDLASLVNSFQTRIEREMYPKEILDYINCRQSLMKLPPINEKIKEGVETK